MTRVRIVIADDHRVVRQGLRTLIESEPDLEVVGEADDGRAALELIDALRPDVLLLDISMAPVSGIRTMEQLRRRRDGPRVLILTAHGETTYVRQMLGAGAAGYVLKRSAAEDLISAIRKVVDGGTYLDPKVAGHVASGFVESKKARAARGGHELSAREREILCEVAWGYSNKEVAQRLGISVKTVETHKANVMAKLELSGRADLVRYALRQNWLTER